MSPGCVIHWFRKGLRLHDNPALLDALKPTSGSTSSPLPLRLVFILDPWYQKNVKIGKNRWRFLIQALSDLDKRLKSLGSCLYVAKGNPVEIFEDLFVRWEVRKITWEEDTEPYSKQRDSKVREVATKHNITVNTFISHTLYNPEYIVSKNLGEVPLTYQKLNSIIKTIGHPPKPLDKPQFLQDKCKSSKNEEEESEFAIPNLEDVGVKESQLEPCLFPGGETEGLKRLELSLKDTRWVREFEKPNTSPNSLKPSTTVLSPYVRFGCLSSRLFYWKLQEIYTGSKHSSPPVSLHGQLFWREFFYTVGACTENFDKMKSNKVCRQIPWSDDPEKLEAWANARTGFPYIDAIMTQLRKEGWIHHLARHSVACFFTRGDLWQSWEKGKEVFEELLLDADWSLNAGNWMWMSASAFFNQYFRVYSPVVFGRKTDPDGLYIKKYLPILAKFPKEYIYEPWTSPLSVQKAAGCIIGSDYPRPIVEHEKVSKKNLAKMKAAFSAAAKRSTEDESPAKKKKLK